MIGFLACHLLLLPKVMIIKKHDNSRGINRPIQENNTQKYIYYSRNAEFDMVFQFSYWGRCFISKWCWQNWLWRQECKYCVLLHSVHKLKCTQIITSIFLKSKFGRKHRKYLKNLRVMTIFSSKEANAKTFKTSIFDCLKMNT